MFLLFPFRALRLLTIGPRLLARGLLHPRHGSLRAALVLLGIAALITFFARRKTNGPST